MNNRQENSLLAKDSVAYESSIKGFVGSSIERTSGWKKLRCFPEAEAAGKLIYKRSMEGKNITDNNHNLLDYLSNWSSGAYTGGEMGNSGDYEAGHNFRRLRLVQMLKSAEQEFLKEKSTPNEDDWERFYGGILGFFEAGLKDEHSKNIAAWIPAYVLFYSAAWGWDFVDAFDQQENLSDQQLKFRGLQGAFLSLSDAKRRDLLGKMSVLDETTNVSLEGQGNLISIEFRRAADNLENFRLVQSST